MKLLLKTIVLIILLVICFGKSYSYDIENKNILILNSYDSENVWTKSQVNGILDTLKKSSLNYNLYIEYMDSKRFSDENHLKQIFNYLYNKYEKQEIDYIIATDDSAFSFLNNNSDAIFGDAKIVFSGLNYLYEMDRNKFTGIHEKIDIENNIEFALKIFPKTERIYLLGEDQVTTRSIALEVDEYLKDSIDIKVDIVLSKNVEFLRNSIEKYSENSIIFFTIFNMDDAGNRYSYEDGYKKIMSNVNIPVFSFWSFYDGLPIVGGYVNDAYLSGQDASLMLLELTDGKSPSEVDIQESQKVYKLNYDMLDNFGVANIKINEEIEYINKPNFIMGNYKMLTASVIIIIILLIIIAMLLYKNNNYSKENLRVLVECSKKQDEIKSSNQLESNK